MPDAGQGTLVHVGEKETKEWCREQRVIRARSQALSGASSTSMHRQGSVLVGPLVALGSAKVCHACQNINELTTSVDIWRITVVESRSSRRLQGLGNFCVAEACTCAALKSQGRQTVTCRLSSWGQSQRPALQKPSQTSSGRRARACNTKARLARDTGGRRTLMRKMRLRQFPSTVSQLLCILMGPLEKEMVLHAHVLHS